MGTVPLCDNHVDDPRERAALIAKSIAIPAQNKMLASVKFEQWSQVVLCINPDWAARTHLTERWTSAPRVPRAGGFAQAQRYQAYALARRHVNVENSVAYADSQGVELRHPLHDFRLTQFLIGASGGMLRRNGARKHLLREAMRGTLPELVRNRRGKADMSPPIIDAVTARLQTRPCGDLQCVKRGWVDAERLEAHQAAHLAWRLGGAVDGVPSAPYAPVWNAIAIDLWLESAVGL